MIKKYLTALALTATVAAAHAFVPTAVALDNGCDTFVGLTTEGTKGAAGTWVNTCTGVSIPVGGAQVRAGANIRIGYVMGSTGATAHAGARGHEVTWWIRDDGTVSLFDFEGVEIYAGTWTKLTAGR